MSKQLSDISPYVTNMNDSVYCLRGLPPEVCAVLFAYVSRSSASFRENLRLLLSQGDVQLSAIGEKTEEFQTAKAARFHEKWVLGYGHSSVAEHAELKIAIDELSILAAKAVEDNRLAAFTEKSSRYQVFDADRFYWPVEMKQSPWLSEARTLVSDLYELYHRLYDPMREELAEACPRPEGLSDKAWESTLHAAACDVIRYLLPAGTLTSMGVSVNARAAAHMIRKLRASSLSELRHLGDRICEEGGRITPVLLKYAMPSTFVRELPDRVRKTGLLPVEEQPVNATERVRLIRWDQDGVQRVLADLLFAFGDTSLQHALQLVSSMDKEERLSLLQAACGGMEKHDWPPRSLEQASITVEFCVDYGAYRDLQRHRMATQSQPLLGCRWGYETPSMLSDNQQYHNLMQRAANLWQKLRMQDPGMAQYFVPLAYRQRFAMQMNLREAEHIIRLRSSAAGHWSYRQAAQDLYHIVTECYPELSSCFRVDLKEHAWARAGEELRRKQGRA